MKIHYRNQNGIRYQNNEKNDAFIHQAPLPPDHAVLTQVSCQTVSLRHGPAAAPKRTPPDRAWAEVEGLE
jgi:hypothetical protein